MLLGPIRSVKGPAIVWSGELWGLVLFFCGPGIAEP